MKYYLSAEFLKMKHTFSKKLIWLMPLITIGLTWVLAFDWYQVNAFNWWYVLLMPAYIGLIAAMTYRRESKMGHRGLLALPVSLKKVWWSKVIILIMGAAVSCLLLMVGILFGRFTVPSPLPTGEVVAGMGLIFLTTLWQIPLCLFLADKVGLAGTIFVQMALGAPAGTLLAVTRFWWLCPYSWTMRMMVPVLGILPNGTLAAVSDPMRQGAFVPIGIGFSTACFIFLMIVTTWWFEKREAK